MSDASNANGIANPAEWRAASQAARRARAEPLCLPSGATILAAKPQPLEWILAGRIPQRLLAVALETSPGAPSPQDLTREEILDLARFATQLVEASVVEPRIGNGPDQIPLEEIPIVDRTFIFEWACRALSDGSGTPAGSGQEDASIPPRGMERFHQK